MWMGGYFLRKLVINGLSKMNINLFARGRNNDHFNTAHNSVYWLSIQFEQ